MARERKPSSYSPCRSRLTTSRSGLRRILTASPESPLTISPGPSASPCPSHPSPRYPLLTVPSSENWTAFCSACGSDVYPTKVTLSSTSTTAEYKGEGLRILRSKILGRDWLPINRRSLNPFVIRSACLWPLRSRSAFVATVVDRRM